MGSSFNEATPKLPFIDFSKPADAEMMMKPGTLYWDSLKSRVRAALEEYGCFEASIDDWVPSEFPSAVFSSLEELFDLPLPTKQRNVVPDTAPYLGYKGQYPVFPLYESMAIDDLDSLDEVDGFTEIFWPQGNPSFSKNIRTLSEKILELDQIMRRMIIESFGLEQYVDDHMKQTKHIMRFTKYEAPQTRADQPSIVGIEAHTDKSMTTVLYQNQVIGLESQTKNGEWVKFQPSSPSSFIVMVGDSLYAWLNGRVHCPIHRVMMSGNEPRYSVGVIASLKPEYIIKTPEELIDEQHPMMFKPFYMEDYLALMYATPPGAEVPSLLEYCARI